MNLGTLSHHTYMCTFNNSRETTIVRPLPCHAQDIYHIWLLDKPQEGFQKPKYADILLMILRIYADRNYKVFPASVNAKEGR